MKKILITGWAGYIWSHMIIKLENNNIDTINIDNLSNSKIQTIENINKFLNKKTNFQQIDLRDKEKLETIFNSNQIDTVIHFAGLKAVGESCEKPWLYFENNINGSINLFNIMEKYWVKNIIFSSSCTVYWEPQYIPIDEKHPLWETTNPYGKTKQLLEKILQDYAEFAWFNVISLRYFNPIWAHPEGFIGDNPQGIPNNLLPYLFKVLNKQLDYLKVFWDDYPTKDGTGIRDYIDIDDLIEGHLKAYQKFNNIKQQFSKGKWSFTAINLWTGRGVSVLDMLKTVEQQSKQTIPYQIKERRSWDLSEIYAKADIAKEILERESKIPLEESIANMLNYYWKTN